MLSQSQRVTVLHSARRPRGRVFPWVTTALAMVALALGLIPGAGEALQFDRAVIAHGQVARLLTGHLTHWTASHLAWDLGAFALLGSLVESRSRSLFTGVSAASALAISVAVYWLQPGFELYRGLSGVDSALFGAAVLTGLTREIGRPQATSWIAVAALAAFIVKCALEIFLGRALFVAPDPAFVPVPLAHAAGAVIGAALGWTHARATSARRCAARTCARTAHPRAS